MSDNEYLYRQGGRVSDTPRIVERNDSCLGALIGALMWVFSGVVAFLVVFFGWKILVQPLVSGWWIMLTTAFGG